MTTLSSQALKVIHDYLHLPFKDRDVSAPYYNNKRAAMRGGLRVLIGKGSPEDIAEEALIISLRDKVSLENLDNETLKKFLVENHLGIDCSGLAYYTLDAECKARGLGNLKKHIVRPYIKNPLRKILVALRPVENTGVRTLAYETNSTPVVLTKAKPGDIITMMQTGPKNDYNHILIVHAVDEITHTIRYTHSFAWRTDGRYNHGVRQGTITITNPSGNLLDQVWNENEKTGADNETWERAKQAKELSLRRLTAFQ